MPHKFPKRNNSSKFPVQLWYLLENCTDGSIKWGEDGQHIVINKSKFMNSELVMQFFNFSKWCSFVRQLNNYGFRKIFPHVQESDGGKCSTPWKCPAFSHVTCYSHVLFERDNFGLIYLITRKKTKRVSKTKRSDREPTRQVITEITQGQECQTMTPYSATVTHNIAPSHATSAEQPGFANLARCLEILIRGQLADTSNTTITGQPAIINFELTTNAWGSMRSFVVRNSTSYVRCESERFEGDPDSDVNTSFDLELRDADGYINGSIDSQADYSSPVAQLSDNQFFPDDFLPS